MSDRERISEIQYPDGTIYEVQDPDVGNIDVILDYILGNKEFTGEIDISVNKISANIDIQDV